MSDPIPIPESRSERPAQHGYLSPGVSRPAGEGAETVEAGSPPSSGLKTPSMFRSSPSSPLLSPLSPLSGNRAGYFLGSTSGSYQEDWEGFPPLDRLTLLDVLDNLALPQRLEKLQQTLSAQTEKVRRQQEKLKSSGAQARERVIEEWRRRVPPPDEQLAKYRRKMRDGVDRLGRRWNDTKAVTTREKASFIAGVLNVFISGYLIGAHPEWVHLWYSLQLGYFMPIRFYTYQRRGYHYFLADLCYFVNMLTMLSIWVFPRSKRLLMSTYCLAYGNNAVAIAMWRNSMVFHSLDKVTSLFIHIMPPVTLHCIVHQIPAELQRTRFPAIHAIKTTSPRDSEYFSLGRMMLWATVPYLIWQLSYHMLITVRRREKIAAGRPTSFTWLRRSYAKNWLGKSVLALPESLQEPAFMLIQYIYAAITMLPCPIWFRYRWLSASFLMVVFTWSIWNGANFYLDVFGRRFQNELEKLKEEVTKWQSSPEYPTSLGSPGVTAQGDTSSNGSPAISRAVDASLGTETPLASPKRTSSIDHIPLLDGRDADASGPDNAAVDMLTKRKS